MNDITSRLPLSVFLITKNCGEWLDAVLTAVRGVAEIIVVDSGSTDDTLTIARQHGARIITQPFLGYGQQKQVALDACTQPWVLNLDGDEVLDDTLRTAMFDLVRADDPAVIGGEVKFRDWFIGVPANKRTRAITRVRLWRRGAGRFLAEQIVHESVQLDAGRVVRLPGWVEHYGVESVGLRVDKINRYSSLRAELDANRGKSPSALKLFLIFPLRFWRNYLLRRAFLDGRRGLIQSMASAYYAFLIEAKKFEAAERARLKLESSSQSPQSSQGGL
ncbi:glycosyltransferase family 2 protein [Halothiobacillus sp. DCM-1]|uniref:glycosyltransferase family 2 protein n=1 Tax=Halothiobacillus sp. DCM-1 TaxID=3112558 RepID=UPI003248E8D7